MANSIQPIATCTYIFHLRLEMSRCKPRILHDRYQVHVPFIANSRIPFDASVKPLMRNNLSFPIINNIISHDEAFLFIHIVSSWSCIATNIIIYPSTLCEFVDACMLTAAEVHNPPHRRCTNLLMSTRTYTPCATQTSTPGGSQTSS